MLHADNRGAAGPPPRSIARGGAVRRLALGALLVVGPLLACRTVAAQGLYPHWAANGVPVKPGPSNAGTAVPVVDGHGGVFVVWLDRDPGAISDVLRVQHLLSDGSHDPAWPQDGVIAGPWSGLFFAAPDLAGGVYVCVGAPGRCRVLRLNHDGSTDPAWAGVDVSVGGYPPFGIIRDRQGGLWAVRGDNDGYCIPDYPYHCFDWGSIWAIRVAPDGSYVSGWEPPGREVFRTQTFTGMTILGGHGTAGGVAFGFRWTTLSYGESVHVGAILLVDPGTSGVLMDAAMGPFGFGYYDGDDLGDDFVYVGEYSYAILQRSANGILWPNPAWVCPNPEQYPALGPGGVAADRAGGAFVRTFFFSNSPTFHVAEQRLIHVLSTGVSDPRWPATGLSLMGAGGEFQSEMRWTQDGRGGFFVQWQDSRSGTDSDIYALRFSQNGSIPTGWSITGQPICMVAGSDQTRPYSTADADGNVFVVWRDARQGDTNIYAQKFSPDVPVPVQVQSASARYVEGRVELTWNLADAPDPSVVVERSLTDEAWSVLGAPAPAPARDQWRFVDDHPVPGAENHYRLNERRTGWAGGDVALVVPGPRSFALTGPVPNPMTAASRFSLEVPALEPVELVVSDILGRQVASRQIQGTSPGALSVEWHELVGLPSGLYWLRASQGGVISTARFVVTR